MSYRRRAFFAIFLSLFLSQASFSLSLSQAFGRAAGPFIYIPLYIYRRRRRRRCCRRRCRRHPRPSRHPTSHRVTSHATGSKSNITAPGALSYTISLVTIHRTHLGLQATSPPPVPSATPASPSPSTPSPTWTPPWLRLGSVGRVWRWRRRRRGQRAGRMWGRGLERWWGWQGLGASRAEQRARGSLNENYLDRLKGIVSAPSWWPRARWLFHRPARRRPRRRPRLRAGRQ